jgi:dual specificity tyrosine-phosphorylation-regulated kinase 2/3/4
MLSVNLYEFIKMNHFQGFSLNLIKRFAIQILISLYFLNENNITRPYSSPPLGVVLATVADGLRSSFDYISE